MLNSNPIYPLIENAVITAFSDSIVGADSELLEKCYVKNADRTKFDNKIHKGDSVVGICECCSLMAELSNVNRTIIR